MNAHHVNNGENIETNIQNNKDEKDFYFIKEYNQEKILEQIISLSNGRLKSFGDYNFFKDIQILTPTKRGLLGTRELNTNLQKNLNKAREDKKEKNFAGTIFREGDKVMQIKNNYELVWTKDYAEPGKGVFNGDLGIIQKINNEQSFLIVKFDDDKVVEYEFDMLEQLELAYAITVHKSQGSEFDVVILPVFRAAPMLLTRNILYTAITRAKKMLIMIGDDSVVTHMIKNQNVVLRNTGLKYKLKKD